MSFMNMIISKWSNRMWYNTCLTVAFNFIYEQKFILGNTDKISFFTLPSSQHPQSYDIRLHIYSVTPRLRPPLCRSLLQLPMARCSVCWCPRTFSGAASCFRWRWISIPCVRGSRCSWLWSKHIWSKKDWCLLSRYYLLENHCASYPGNQLCSVDGPPVRYNISALCRVRVSWTKPCELTYALWGPSC